MTSTRDDRETTPGFWRDWFTRIGVGIWVAIFVGLQVYGQLAAVGSVRPLKGATIEDLQYFEKLAYLSAIYPGLIGFFLVVIGAGRTLRRKKIFW